MGHYNAPNNTQYSLSSDDPRFPPITQPGYQSQHQAGPANGYLPQGYGSQPPQQQPPQYPSQQTTQSYYQPPVSYQHTPSQSNHPQPSYSQDSYQSYQSTYASHASQHVPKPS